jgi:hypothetical protein
MLGHVASLHNYSRQTNISGKMCHFGVTNVEDLTPGSSTLGSSSNSVLPGIQTHVLLIRRKVHYQRAK